MNHTDLEKSRLEWKLDGVSGAGVKSIREGYARGGLLRESYRRFPKGTQPSLDEIREDLSRSNRRWMMPAIKRKGLAHSLVIAGWLFLGVGGALVWAFLHWVVFQAATLEILARIGFMLLGWLVLLVVLTILFFIARLGIVGIAVVGVIILVFILIDRRHWTFTALLTGWAAWQNVGEVPLGTVWSESIQAGFLVARDSTGSFFVAAYLALIVITLGFLATRVTLLCYVNLSTEPFSYRFLVKSRDLLFIPVIPVFALARAMGNKSKAQEREKVRHS